MKLRDYIDQLDVKGELDYAERCGIAGSYLRIHVKYASKDPSVSLIRRLAAGSENQVSIVEVLQHYRIL
ncbi:hypothetical protein [Pseudomonas guariconensis]|uniref:hypothetical protein n=1 Tax=Pseudomonas guariconensis TaxID=1288410 RepID=UPI002FE6B5D3